LSREEGVRVFTDPLASPTGFPFKVARMDGTLSEKDCYSTRERVCDLGYLRQLYRKPDGEVGYRCPAEPENNYVRRGGNLEETLNRKCICNALPATVGMGQPRSDGRVEPPIVTAGDDLTSVSQFLEPGRDSYTAAEVVERLLNSSAHPLT
jgi:NAD(P)H-dependent flavin oxidoreductase YrpB (nitropropane dioxygenase family)